MKIVLLVSMICFIYLTPIPQYIAIVYALRNIIVDGNKIIEIGPSRDCDYTSSKSLPEDMPLLSYIDCMKRNGKLQKIVYDDDESILSGIYRCESKEGDYIGELRITIHFYYVSDFDCSYSIFKKDLNISIGGATFFYTP